MNAGRSNAHAEANAEAAALAEATVGVVKAALAARGSRGSGEQAASIRGSDEPNDEPPSAVGKAGIGSTGTAWVGRASALAPQLFGSAASDAEEGVVAEVAAAQVEVADDEDEDEEVAVGVCSAEEGSAGNDEEEGVAAAEAEAEAFVEAGWLTQHVGVGVTRFFGLLCLADDGPEEGRGAPSAGKASAPRAGKASAPPVSMDSGLAGLRAAAATAAALQRAIFS